MNAIIAKRLVSIIALAASAGSMHAAFAADASLVRGDGQSMAAARIGDRDVFTEGARIGERSVFTDGARTVAGLDRTGVSADPARTLDPFLDGARIGERSVFTDGARAVS